MQGLVVRGYGRLPHAAFLRAAPCATRLARRRARATGSRRSRTAAGPRRGAQRSTSRSPRPAWSRSGCRPTSSRAGSPRSSRGHDHRAPAAGCSATSGRPTRGAGPGAARTPRRSTCCSCSTPDRRRSSTSVARAARSPPARSTSSAELPHGRAGRPRGVRLPRRHLAAEAGRAAAAPGAAGTVPAGEFVLGYPNEYGQLTDATAARPPLPTRERLLPRDPGGTGSADLGATAPTWCCASCARTSTAFQAFTARAPPGTRRGGRTRRRPACSPPRSSAAGRSGAPLVLAPDAGRPVARRQQRLRLPRRSTRDGLAARSARTSGGPTRATRCQPQPGHRGLAGRSTAGTGCCAAAAATASPTSSGRRVRRCTSSASTRTWPASTSSSSTRGSTTPCSTARRRDRPAGRAAQLQAQHVHRRRRVPYAGATRELPQFVQFRGGAYFFLPGIRALRFLASPTCRRRRGRPMQHTAGRSGAYHDTPFWRSSTPSPSCIDRRSGGTAAQGAQPRALIGLRDTLRALQPATTPTTGAGDQPRRRCPRRHPRTRRPADASTAPTTTWPRPAMGMAGTRFGRNVPLRRTPSPSTRRAAADAQPAAGQHGAADPRAGDRSRRRRSTCSPPRGCSSRPATGSATARTPTRPFEVPRPPGDDWPDRPDALPRTAARPARRRDDASRARSSTPRPHWWDASQIYGSTPEFQRRRPRPSWARARSRSAPDGLIDVDPALLGSSGGLDGWWVGLELLHTLFMREHNAICDVLHAAYPAWTDDELFEKARLVIAALSPRSTPSSGRPRSSATRRCRSAMRANWFGLAGERVHRLLGRLSGSEIISGIPGSPTDHHGVPYSLTEEFVAVYRMHPLIPDDFDAARRRPTRDRVEQLHVPATLARPAARAGARARVGASRPVLLASAPRIPGAVTLHNYPRFLQQLRPRPDGMRDRPRRRRHPALPRARRARATTSSAGCCTCPRPASFEELTERPGDRGRAAPRCTTATSRTSTSRSGLLRRDAARRLRVQRHRVPHLHPDGVAAAEERPVLHHRLHARRSTRRRAWRWIDDNDMAHGAAAALPASSRPRCAACENAFAPWPARGQAGMTVVTAAAGASATQPRSARPRSGHPGIDPDGLLAASDPPAERPVPVGCGGSSGASSSSTGRWFDRWLRPPLFAALQALQNRCAPTSTSRSPRSSELPDEEQLHPGRSSTRSSTFTRENWLPGGAQRFGNTKTFGVLRGEFTVLRRPAGAPAARAVRASRGTYPAWVRFSGPGPYAPPDLEDFGQCSVGIKVMGVAGPKLMDDERRTQDLILVSPASFVTPDIRENAKLQRWVRAKAPLGYAINPGDTHLLHLVDAAALLADAREPAGGAVLQQRPVPARRGPGGAVLAEAGSRDRRTRDPARSRRRTTCATRWCATLAEGDWAFDFMVQVQTDPHRMPIEDATVKWPERLSPVRPRRAAAAPAPAVRLRRAARVRRRPALQPLAQPARAPPAGQLEPGPAADVLRARQAAPADERRRRTSSRPARRRSRMQRPGAGPMTDRPPCGPTARSPPWPPWPRSGRPPPRSPSSTRSPRSRSCSPTASSRRTATTPSRRTARAGTVASGRRWRSCERAVWWTPPALRRRPAWPGRYPRRRLADRGPRTVTAPRSAAEEPLLVPGVIAAPLRDPEARRRMGFPDAEDQPVPVMAEVNLRFGGGRSAALARLDDLWGRVTGGRRPRHVAGQYAAGELSMRQVERLVAADAAPVAWRAAAASTACGPTSRCNCTSTPPASRSRRTRPAARSTPSATTSCGRSSTPGSRRTTRTSPPTTPWTIPTSSTCTATSPATASPTPDGALDDEVGHGTHVAGIIAGAIAPWLAEKRDRRTVRATENRHNPANPQQPLRMPRAVEEPELLAGIAPRAKLVSLKAVKAGGTLDDRVNRVIAALAYVREVNGEGDGRDAHPRRQPQRRLRVRPRVVRLRPEPAVRRGRPAGPLGRRRRGGSGQLRLRRRSRCAIWAAPTKFGLGMTINDPGNAERAITVGSTHRDAPHAYGVSYFSSKGPTGDGRCKPDLVAPGRADHLAARPGQRLRGRAGRATRPRTPPSTSRTAARAWPRRTCPARSRPSSRCGASSSAARTGQADLHRLRDVAGPRPRLPGPRPRST